MSILKSKVFWSFASIGGTLTLLVAYDRQKLYRIRSQYIKEAIELGLQPSPEGTLTRKVTLIAFGQDSFELRSIKQSWRNFAVDLFTKAGCDYQWIEVDATSLDKEVDKLMPVPDGELPPTDKPIPKIVNVNNWIKPLIKDWVYKINGIRTPLVESSEPSEVALRKVWEEKQPQPRSTRLFDDGIIALDQSSMSAIKTGMNEALKGQSKAIKTPRLGYIPCDSSPSWYWSIYRYFNKSKLAESIGEATMDILREKSFSLHPQSPVRYFTKNCTD